MKKLLYLILLLPSLAIGQVINPTPDMVFKGQLGAGRGVGTDPSAWLSIGPTVGSVRGVVFPQVSDTNAVVSPRRNGLFIWSRQRNRFLYWDSTAVRWKDIPDVSNMDTTLISTRAWRQKGIDSLASRITGSISGNGTQYYVPRYGIGGTTLNTGTMYDSASRIGIGTTVPSTKLHVVTPEILGLSVQSQSTIAASSAQLFNAFNATYLGVNGADGNSLITGSAPYNSFIGSGQNYGLDLGTNLTTRMTILPSGQVRVNNLAGTGTRMVVADTSGRLSTQTITSGVGGSGTLNYVSKWTPNGSLLSNSRIYDNGTNIGIGTESFSFTTGTGIHLKTSGDANIKVSSGTKAGFDIVQAVSGNVFAYNRDNADVIFGTQNAERMRITGEEGQIRINSDTTLGNYKFQVAGNAIIRDGLNVRSLSGVSTRMVVSDSVGNLSTQAIPAGGSGGSGTVTSVSAGVGMNFPTITTSGAVNADTLVLATRSRVMKSIDSLALTVSSGGGGVSGSGITNRVVKWTPNGTTLGNTIMHDTDSSISVGTNPSSIIVRFDVRASTGRQDAVGIRSTSSGGTNGIGVLGEGSANSGDGNNFAVYGSSFGVRPSGINIGGYFEGGNAQVNNALVTGNGNVGIGTFYPQQKLDINGGLRIGTVDSINTPTNILYQDPSGIIKKASVASVSSGGGSVDTTLLSTRAWRKKGDDSLAALFRRIEVIPDSILDYAPSYIMRDKTNGYRMSYVKTFRPKEIGHELTTLNGWIYTPLSSWSQTEWNIVAFLPITYPSAHGYTPPLTIYFTGSNEFPDAFRVKTVDNYPFSGATVFSKGPTMKVDQLGFVYAKGVVDTSGPILTANGVSYVGIGFSTAY